MTDIVNHLVVALKVFDWNFSCPMACQLSNKVTTKKQYKGKQGEENRIGLFSSRKRKGRDNFTAGQT